jgi:uncharacterized OB-fold protein
MGLENLADIINKAMVVEVNEYGDEATVEFYKNLKEREFKSTKCKACGEVALPPRMFCPACFKDEVEWIDLPRKGKLYAFTQQERSLRFGKPDVIGTVELPDIGFLLTRIDAPFDSLSIGQEVELDFIDVSDQQTLHQFRPIK